MVYNVERRSRPPHLANPTSSSSIFPAASADEIASPTVATNADTAVRTRQRPAHLSSPSAADPNVPRRPARGRRQDSNQPATAPNIATAPDLAADPSGWGHIGHTPGAGSVGSPSVSGKVPADAKSEAASSTGGWGHLPRGPWDAASAASAPSAKGKGKSAKKTWAEEMEDEDDSRSVAESSTGGWATLSNAPWA